MLEAGSIVDGWRIDATLHEGSMAVTYAARHWAYHGPCVLKVLQVRDRSFQERLRRAGSALRAVTHPHLVPVLDVITFEGQVAVVSKLIEGTHLGTWSTTHPRSLGDHVQLFRKACSGLQAAHAAGMVHRNLKPTKILVDTAERPYIHDFMLGKVVSGSDQPAVTQMGTTFGTPQYMAPEQFRGAAAVDARADVFSMGCILFEQLTGRRAFDGKGLVEIYEQVTMGERTRLLDIHPGHPPELEQLLVDMLAPEPAERLASMEAVIHRLDHDPTLQQLVRTPSIAELQQALQSAPPVRTPHRPTSEDTAPTSDRPASGGLHRGSQGPAIQKPPASSEAATQWPDQLTASGDSEDSLPSLITFTDGESQDSQLPEHIVADEGVHHIDLDDDVLPTRRQLSPMTLGGLTLLFLATAALGAYLANLSG